MNENKVFKASVWYIASNSISKLAIYAFTPLYVRMLTKAEYGEYSNFLSWQAILVTVLTLNLNAAVARAYYDFNEEGAYGAFVKTISLSGILIPGGFSIIILLFSSEFQSIFSMEPFCLKVMLFSLTFSNSIEIFQSVQRVQVKYKASSILTLILAAASLSVTIILVVFMKDKLIAAIIGNVAVNSIISMAISLYFCLNNEKIDFKCLKYAFWFAFPLIPHVLAGTLLGTADKVMIMKYCGAEQVALYALPYTISMVITMIASSINKAWAPYFYESIEKQEYESIKNYSYAIILGMTVIAIAANLLAPEVLYVIGGEKYSNSVNVMPIIIVCCLVNCNATFYSNVSFFYKKTARISAVTMVVATTNVLLNYCLVGRYGYISAACTSLLSSLLGFALHYFIVLKQNGACFFYNKAIIFLIVVSVLLIPCFQLIYPYVAIRMLLLLCDIGMAIKVYKRYLTK